MAERQTPDEARRERMKKDDKRDAAYLNERKRVKNENAEKTLRLRTLRLAKEAAEREVAEKEAAERAANPDAFKRKKKKVAVVADTEAKA